MAVPKRKTTPSKRGQRRSHDALKPVNVSVDKVTGEYVRRHHMDAKNGVYRGKKMIDSEKIRSKF